jgi:hypothetical protein
MAATNSNSPTITLPGSIGIPAISPTYVDGIPVSGVETTGRSAKSNHKFWSSQAHLPSEEIEENLVISLARNRIINYIEVKLAHFPCDMAVWFWNNHVGYWQPVLRQNGAPLVFRIRGSVPAVVNSAAALTSKTHPYHYGAGHWVAFNETLTNFSADKLRFTAVRPLAQGSNDNNTYPVDPHGKLVPYPVGVKGLDFGFTVNRPGAVPWTARSGTVTTERQPFTDTDDVNGNPVLVVLRENRAANLLAGQTWRSLPQVSSDAVVSLYVDARDVNGNAQVIDQFYLNPVTSGNKLNLYYSATGPTNTEFQALDDPILFPLVQVSGSSLPQFGAAGCLFPDVAGWVTLSNQGLGTQSNLPWWVGLEIQPQFASTDAGSYMIADSGLLQLYFTAGTWYATLAGAVVARWSFTHHAGDTLHFTAAYDGQQIMIWSDRGGQMFAVPAGTPVPSAATFRFGASLEYGSGGPAWAGNYLLTAFVLKQEVAASSDPDSIPDQFEDFAAGGTAYVAPDTGTSDFTMNALARFHPSFVLGTTNPTGFVGGPGSSFESCTWTPVTRNYALAQGYLEFDPILAAVFKLEFTSLTPEPVDYVVPSTSTMKSMPPNPSVSSAETGQPVALDPGLEIGQSVAPSLSYSDATPPNPAPTQGASKPTEAMYVTDPVAASQTTQAAGSLYNFQNWRPSQYVTQPGGVDRQVTAGTHSYQESDLPVTSRAGYYVALAAITMYRASYLAQYDTEQYTDNFGDTANIAPSSLDQANSWTWGPGMLLSPGSAVYPAQVQSQVFNSNHLVRGVQFATVQSDPVQLLPDPDFNDTTLATWAAVGDAEPLTFAPVNAQLGNMIQVTRQGGVYGWDYFLANTLTWTQIQAQFPTWAAMEDDNVSNAYGGVEYVGPPVPTTGAGRVYAAARVFSPMALDAPLTLQLLDGATGALLAEESQTVLGGTVTEWFTGYTLGTPVYGTVSWATMQSTYTTWGAFPLLGANVEQIQTWDFETGIQGWTGQGATVSQSTGWAQSGTHSLLATATSADSGLGYFQAQSPLFPIQPLKFYTFQLTLDAAVNLASIGLVINWYTAASSYISSSATAFGALASGVSETLTITGAQAPSNAAFAQVIPKDGEALTPGPGFYTDAVGVWLSAGGPAWAVLDTTVAVPGATVTAQLIQQDSTDDTWQVDSIAVFEDAIVWEFSNDGGASWWPAYDVRNNPRGVMIFPTPMNGQGTQLMWRLQGYAPNLAVTALAIRPWYSVWPMGVLPRPGGVAFGPNVSTQDQYAAVENDPRWQIDASPVPASWYFATRQALGLVNLTPLPETAPSQPEFGLGNALVYEAPEGATAEPGTYGDFYIDTYIDAYGIPDGGDVYTDTYCDVYGKDNPVVTTGTVRSGSASSTSAVTETVSGAEFTPPPPLLGAALGQVAGNSGTVTSFVTLTGQSLKARRVFFGNSIPTALTGSLVAADAGVRRVSMDFWPDATTTPAQLYTFLASCAAGGLQAEVTLWAGEAASTFDTPAEYFALLEQYVPVIRLAGYTFVWAEQNSLIVHDNVLASWYPGDGLVDAIAPAFYCEGPAPGAPGGDSLAVVAAFADTHGKPLGLCEFGADHAVHTAAQGEAFLTYIQGLFAARTAAGKLNGDLIYDDTGNYALASAPAQFVTLYQQIGAAL